MSQTDPGWYYADGDPPGTMRYWDGARWVGEPTTQQPTYATPGGYRFGSAGERLGARIIDGIIAFVIAIVLAAIFVDFDEITDGTPPIAFILIAIVFGVLYEVGFVALKGATPGKMVLGLKVITQDGQDPPGWGPAALRWLPALAGNVPAVGPVLGLVLAIASGVMISNDDQNRSVQDRLGTTYVIKK